MDGKYGKDLLNGKDRLKAKNLLDGKDRLNGKRLQLYIIK